MLSFSIDVSQEIPVAHSLPYGIYSAYASGHYHGSDPGDGGELEIAARTGAAFEVNPSSSGETRVVPSASDYPAGIDFTVSNYGSYACTLVDSDDDTVATIPSGTMVLVRCAKTSSSNQWESVLFTAGDIRVVYVDDYDPDPSDASPAISAAIAEAERRYGVLTAIGADASPPATSDTRLNRRLTVPIVFTGGKKYVISETIQASNKAFSLFLTSDSSQTSAIIQRTADWTESDFAVAFQEIVHGGVSNLIFDTFHNGIKIGYTRDEDQAAGNAGPFGTNLNGSSKFIDRCTFISQNDATDDCMIDIYDRSADVTISQCSFDNPFKRAVRVRSCDIVRMNDCRIYVSTWMDEADRDQYEGFFEVMAGQLFCRGLVANPSGAGTYDDGSSNDKHISWFIAQNHPALVEGTHDGSGNAAVLTDSGASWTVDEFVGETIHNLTDGSSGTVTSNTAATITAKLSGGADDDWDASDKYYLKTASTSVWCRIHLDQCHMGAESGGITPVIWNQNPYDDVDVPTTLARSFGVSINNCLCGTTRTNVGEGPAGTGIGPAVLLVKQPNRLVVRDNVFTYGANCAAAYPLNDSAPSAFWPTNTKRQFISIGGNTGGGASIATTPYFASTSWYPRDLSHRVFDDAAQFTLPLAEGFENGSLVIVDNGNNLATIQGGYPGMMLSVLVKSGSGLVHNHAAVGHMVLNGAANISGAANGTLVTLQCYNNPDDTTENYWVQVGVETDFP